LGAVRGDSSEKKRRYVSAYFSYKDVYVRASMRIHERLNTFSRLT
jgi:hypothetical protein